MAGIPQYPLGIDTDATLGPTVSIVPSFTTLQAGDELGILRNLITASINLETVVGIPGSAVTSTHDFKITALQAVATAIASFKVSDGNPPATNYGYFGTRDSGTLAVWQFDGSGTDTAMIFTGVVPRSVTWATGWKALIVWASTSATTGAAEWKGEVDNADSHSIDTDSYGTAVSVITTTSGTAAKPNYTTISLPAANLQSAAAGLPFKFRLTRRASDASNDTIAEKVSVWMVQIYTY